MVATACVSYLAKDLVCLLSPLLFRIDRRASLVLAFLLGFYQLPHHLLVSVLSASLVLLLSSCFACGARVFCIKIIVL